MALEIEGRIVAALPEISGESKATGKPWKKREYVLETHETYPKKVHFDFFGERADLYPLAVGDEVKLSFDIESREYQGRWYTSIRGWKAEKPGQSTLQNAQQAPMQPPFGTPTQGPAQTFPGGYGMPQAPEAPQFPGDTGSNDNLPF